ncbi:MAG: carbohydrate-binding domain-containing protein [Clostridia bacterium]|nr:carbohydrate-binding domain-containing protein [Clostridia bacterium]
MKKNDRIKRKVLAVIIAFMLLTSSLLTSCQNSEVEAAATVTSVQSQTVTEVPSVEADYDSDDLKTDFNTAEISTITLSNQKIEYSGSNAVINNSKITILSSGVYTISGSMDNGQIVIDSQNDGTVFVILNGVNLSCLDSAPIYIENADKTVISLAEGTQNFLSDSVNYILSDMEDEEPNATLFSEDDLTINGAGSLTIDANYKHGINCKDDLVIISGNITVNAVSDGIRGRDSITVADGNINITADNDGMQSNNDKDTEKGYILVDGGIINICSGNDGMQAETDVVINAGDITITAGGGTKNTVVAMSISEQEKDSMVVVEETESTKGIKAGSTLIINGGNISVDSHDDSLHANMSIYITEGNIVLSTDDDGIHSENNLTIDGGLINILDCYEAIESMVITVNDGEIRLNASDDGFNATDGTATAMVPGMEVANSKCILTINGGYIVANSNGDSIDSNGNIYMTGGVVIANGPMSPTNGTLDSDGEFYISGGLLIAVGSSGMAESPDAVSDQYSLLYLYDTLQTAGTIIYIESEEGEQILAYETSREYQSIAFSSPELEKGVTYKVYSVDSMDSAKTDGVYENGTYSNGTLIGQFTISSTLTVVGTQSRQSQGGGIAPGGAGGPAGRRP